MSVIVRASTDEHSLRSQVGIGSQSDGLFGQFDGISWISDSKTEVKTEKSGGSSRRISCTLACVREVTCIPASRTLCGVFV